MAYACCLHCDPTDQEQQKTNGWEGWLSGTTAAVVRSEEEHQDAPHRLILPTATKNATAQKHPVVVVLSGPSGAGKTEVADLVQAALDRRGVAVRIGRDLYEAAHRHLALPFLGVRRCDVTGRSRTRAPPGRPAAAKASPTERRHPEHLAHAAGARRLGIG
ncbi:zeta toxin family protein [Streptomyces sp. YH02]|uniref:zeta toxin family protein n=1 Tax=Streptomyces sp. YH02 TaxID=3256999 RepID=UPI003756893E